MRTDAAGPVPALPLDGIRVLDFSRVMAGPLATQLLADFGADVVKVEGPRSWDIMRSGGSRPDGADAAYFLALNRNKRCMTIDLRAPDARAAVLKLSEQVDVVVHNFRVGVMEALRLTYDDIAAVNPRIVYASISGFGDRGPLATRPGQDFLAQSLSGMARRTSDPGAAPALFPTPVTDFGAGVLAAFGILVALAERATSGRGQSVSSSLFGAALTMQLLELSGLATQGVRTNFHTAGLIDIFETSDGWVTLVGGFRTTLLRDMSRAFGIGDVTDKDGWVEATTAGRVPNREEVLDFFRPHFRQRNSAAVIALLEGFDILCAPVLDEVEVLTHPQVQANGMLWKLPTDEGHQVVGNPVRLGRTPAAVRHTPEPPGASTRDLLGSTFELDEEDVERWCKGGVFG